MLLTKTKLFTKL